MSPMPATKPLRVQVIRLPHGRDLALPAYQTEGAAGMDLLAAVSKTQALKPGGRILVPTGLIMEVPPGYEAQVRPRSGLAFRHGVTVLNAPGTIDSDYRGEVQVLLVNLGEQAFRIARGERIAQLVVQRVERVELYRAEDLSDTHRGAGGFGSTGTTGKQRAAKTKRKRRATKITSR